MRCASWLVLTLTACSSPPPRKPQTPTLDEAQTSTPLAGEPTPTTLAPIDPTHGRREHDLAVETWGPPDDLASHVRYLHGLDPETDARCRNPEIIGTTVAEQIERFEPGEGVERSLGCSGLRCRVRIVSVGERRIVGLEIRYTRTSDGRPTEVDCDAIRGG